MIDVHELLRQKENDIIRVRQEINALQLVAPLLSDSDEGYAAPANGHSGIAAVETDPNGADSESYQDRPSDEAETAEASSDSIPPKRGILRDWFNRAAGE